MNELMFAIDYLRSAARILKAEGTHAESCDAAIRVLEAAGKVDKRLAFKVLDAVDVDDPPSSELAIGVNQLSGLVAALPDKPEGGEG